MSKDNIALLREVLKHMDTEPTVEEKKKPLWDTTDKKSEEVKEEPERKERRPEKTPGYDIATWLKKGMIWVILGLLSFVLIFFVVKMNSKLSVIENNQSHQQRSIDDVNRKLTDIDKSIGIYFTKILERMKSKEE